jgi:nitrogen fixation protein FixH
MIAIGRRRPFEVTGRFVLVCFVGFFLVVAAMNAIMIRFAVTTFGGVETESSYKAGLAFKAEVASSVAQQALGWNVDVRIDRQGQGTALNIAVRDASGVPVPSLSIDVNLAHPADRRKDVVASATEQSAGSYRAMAPAALGRRTVSLELSRNGERMFRAIERVVLP